MDNDSVLVFLEAEDFYVMLTRSFSSLYNDFVEIGVPTVIVSVFVFFFLFLELGRDSMSVGGDPLLLEFEIVLFTSSSWCSAFELFTPAEHLNALGLVAKEDAESVAFDARFAFCEAFPWEA
jgi:hypothetical protein